MQHVENLLVVVVPPKLTDSVQKTDEDAVELQRLALLELMSELLTLITTFRRLRSHSSHNLVEQP